jgi:diguanylate cyclase (GGDEF)-like protein
VDLTPPDEDRTTARASVRSSFVRAYVAVVCSLGALGLGFAVAGTDWSRVLSHTAFWTIAFLAVAALLGEIKPLVIARGDEPAESVSTSTPFVFALLTVGGVGPAVVAQVVASLADDLIRRRDLTKSAFNLAQYTLSVLAARGVYAALAPGVDYFDGPLYPGLEHLVPLLLGGITMVVLNRLLVGGVVAIASGIPLRVIVTDDAVFFVSTHGVMLCIGGAAANVAASGTAFVALLCAPAIAVYLTAAAAVRQAYHASHDTLTGLGNRDRLYGQLTNALAATGGDADRGPGLVLIDLDHFKDINDTLGHPVGDVLLRNVADRLSATLPDAAVAHRLGGDEFAVVVHGDLEASEALAQSLLASLETPILVGDLELLVRGSAGVATAPEHGTDAATLMKNADIALYQAKLERDRTQVYSPRFDVNTVERLQLLSDLRTALEVGQLTVAYQPQVDLVDRRVVAVEALIRWRHPTRGQVPPDSFIPLAENSGLIAQLTAYVLDRALVTLAGWRALGHDIRMSVNLSARQLSDQTLPGQVGAALERHGVPARSLVLEVTETGILADPGRVDVVIAALRALGVAIAVDDYGTGQASLNYLKRLEIDELKVDRSFVSDMGRDRLDYVIVRSTIGLARDLGLRVIAEGIQEESTAVALRELGCGVGQGYHLGRPTTPEEILERLTLEARDRVPRGDH